LIETAQNAMYRRTSRGAGLSVRGLSWAKPLFFGEKLIFWGQKLSAAKTF